MFAATALKMNKGRDNKDKKVQLLSDLGRFKGKKITVTFVDGKSVTGKLSAFDDVANCVLKRCEGWEYGSAVVCLGRSIVLVSLDVPYVL